MSRLLGNLAGFNQAFNVSICLFAERFLDFSIIVRNKLVRISSYAARTVTNCPTVLNAYEVE